MAAPVTNIFAGLSLVLDRMAERRDQEAWLAEQCSCAQARYLVLDPSGESYLLREAEHLRWLGEAERRELFADVPASLLGIAEGCPHFLLALDEAPLAEALQDRLAARRIGLREAGLRLSAAEAGLFAYAKGLAHWQRETRFCSGCGAPLERVAAGHRMRCTSPSCGRLHFPRTDAAIIAIVEYEGACLLGRQASWPKGRWSALAGFVEPGESLEAAVAREVREESGVIVGQVRYLASQPWPFPMSLMLGFDAKYESGEPAIRDQELQDVKWFSRAELAAAAQLPESDNWGVPGDPGGPLQLPPRLAIARRLIEHWLAEA